MKAWLAAVALASLVGCLENPGVDSRLEMKDDLASGDFYANGNSVRVLLERRNGETRLFLENVDGPGLDSVGFALQVCPEGSMAQGYFEGLVGPAYCPDPLAETHGTAVILPGRSAADFGPLEGNFPGELNRVNLLFTSLRDRYASTGTGSDRSGYYQGTWSENRSDIGARSGSLGGYILKDGSFLFLLRTSGGFYGPLWGVSAGDSLVDAYNLDHWAYHRSEALSDSKNPPALFRSPDGFPDSLGFNARFIAHMLPQRPDTLELRVSLSRSPGLEAHDPAVEINTLPDYK